MVYPVPDKKICPVNLVLRAEAASGLYTVFARGLHTVPAVNPPNYSQQTEVSKYI
jgi:hypothetical protein